MKPSAKYTQHSIEQTLTEAAQDKIVSVVNSEPNNAWQTAILHQADGPLLRNLRWYVLIGQPPGGFLTAVLQNQLVESYNRADPSSVRVMGSLAKYIYNDLPTNAWGQDGEPRDWVQDGGYLGRDGDVHGFCERLHGRI